MEYIHNDRSEEPDAVQSLASGIAHDFNNLLAAIKGHASLMMNNISPADPLYGNIKEIMGCIDKGSDIANQLLGFAKVDACYPSPVDLNRLVRRAMENLNIQGKRIVLDVDLDAGPLTIQGDVEKINQAFMAIVENALQAMPGGGKLSVTTEVAQLLNGTAEAFGLDPGQFAKITVTDSGVGMEKDVLPQIFRPFYTADHTNHPERKGLGLTFAREIIRRHQGVIDVWSSPRVGTSFAVILPLSQGVENSDFPSAEDKLSLGHESVLLVDDEQRILTVGREICKALGYQVITAASGQEALSIYTRRKDEINLVILDMIMPEMNGLETFLELKKENPDIKVLLSTGYSIDDKAQEMLKHGCKGYILKPYSVIDFSHKIREALG
ncbi:MAG: response regulator [Desulfobacterales bacterium]|nr:response regulator [Desulfobacterales bacterium]